MQERQNLSELEQKKFNHYQNYPGRPRLYDACQAVEKGMIQFNPDGTVFCKGLAGENGETVLQPNQYHDLVIPTMQGLIENLVEGTVICQQFIDEWGRYSELIEEGKEYGVLVYYPERNCLVRLMEPFWHHLSLLSSNSELYQDQEGRKSWEEVRQVFEKIVVGIAGCSVGNNIAFCVKANLCPRSLKLADLKAAHLANANRVRWDFKDIGQNKAVVTARQLHALDPYLGISVFSEGIHQGNIQDFIAGDIEIEEPKATIIVEETDDPDMKVFIREKAREHKVPVLMVTDAGSLVQIDIRRFDLDPSLSLAVGVSDDELYTAQRETKANPGNRDIFYRFAFKLIGTDHLQDEFERIVRRRVLPYFGSVPQLGSTASVAGGWVAENICRMALGYPHFERAIINLKNNSSVNCGQQFSKPLES